MMMWKHDNSWRLYVVDEVEGAQRLHCVSIVSDAAVI